MSNKTKSGDNFTKKKGVARAVLRLLDANLPNKHFYEKRDFHSFMNKQTWAGWATKEEYDRLMLETVLKLSDKIKIMNDKIDEVTQVNDKMVKLIDKVNEKIDKVYGLVDEVDEKIDKVIKMVDLIDFVSVRAESNFAKSSYKFCHDSHQPDKAAAGPPNRWTWGGRGYSNLNSNLNSMSGKVCAITYMLCLKSIPHDHAFKEFKLSQDATHPE